MNPVRALIRLIEAGLLLGRRTFEGPEVAALLNSRDDRSFETEWLSLFRRLEALPALDDEDKKQVDALREKAFKVAYKHSREPDLAGYVSDDFEVIGRGLLVTPADSFVQRLLNTYAQGRVPGAGKLSQARPTEQVIAELESEL